MKHLFRPAAIAATLLLCAVFCQAQDSSQIQFSPPIYIYGNAWKSDTIINDNEEQKEIRNPMIVDNKLAETILITQGGRVLWSGISYIRTCKEFIIFKEKYPLFMISKNAAKKFPGCVK